LSVSALCIQSKPRFTSTPAIDPAQEQVIVNQKGRTERIFVNLEAIYPSPDIAGSELSLEELRASHRGWLSKIWSPENLPKLNNVSMQSTEPDLQVEELRGKFSEKLVIARDPVTLDENGAAKEPSREGKGRRMRIKEVNETQISKTSLIHHDDTC
jgi:checkpoint serine/threonine-protein kinase